MRILIVEDEPDLCRSLARSLREESYAVDTAYDGKEGLIIAKDTNYDCIVLDGMLPSLDGWEFLERLRLVKKTPVIMLTARDAMSDRILGLNGGADDYLTKPFDLEELLARIRSLIRRSQGEASSVIELGEIIVNTAGRFVSKAGVPIPLTAREYTLLEYLAFNRGKVISRTELYDHLFGDDDNSLSNLLDVHVSNLRKKLGNEVIQTRRGHGYSIIE